MPNYRSLSDIELAGLLRSGDKLAFSEIFNRYWDKTYIHALKMLQDEDEAKDLVQDLFTSLWERSADLNLQTNFAGYLYMMTRNRVLNFIRQKKTRSSFEDALASYIETNQHSVLEQISEKELAQAFESEIMNLPARMREIFILSRSKYLSHREIGLELHISDNTVKKQISNALKIIRVKLNRTMGVFLFF